MRSPAERSALRRCLLLLAVTLLVGCYAYAPLDRSPFPGEDVRARLTAPGALRVAEMTGSTDRAVEGTVVAWDETAVLARLRRDLPHSLRAGMGRDTMRIPLEVIDRVEGRRFSYTRTALFGGALAIGGVLLIKGIQLAAGGSDSPGNGPPGFLVVSH